MLDIAYVGSGMGASLSAALNHKKNIKVFEKDQNLGGCASTFERQHYHYNAGATTFVGYEHHHPVKKIFDYINLQPDISQSNIAIRTIQNNKVVDRVKEFDRFLEQINDIYPHPNNKTFWKTLKQIDEKFWNIQKNHQLFFGKHSFANYAQTIQTAWKLFGSFGLSLLKNAKDYIDETLTGISQEYQNFIEAQLLITVQTTSQNISLLGLALGLSYPFHDVFYANKGMGNIITDLLKDIPTSTKNQITKIETFRNHFVLHTSNNSYEAKNIVVNSTIYDSSKLFDNNQIKQYYDSFEFSDQSAFVVYLTLDNSSKKTFLDHYQVILDQIIPNCISNSFFISFSHSDDPLLSKNNTLSVTISTHTKGEFWTNLDKQSYKNLKTATHKFILQEFLRIFDTIEEENIINQFSGTSKTFSRFINRVNCGGKGYGVNNIMQIPSCNSPFKGIYNAGDTVFAGQGWPGVAVGVHSLQYFLK